MPYNPNPVKKDRNQRIVELKKQGKSYNDITRILPVEFPQDKPISVQRVAEIYHQTLEREESEA